MILVISLKFKKYCTFSVLKRSAITYILLFFKHINLLFQNSTVPNFFFLFRSSGFGVLKMILMRRLISELQQRTSDGIKNLE